MCAIWRNQRNLPVLVRGNLLGNLERGVADNLCHAAATDALSTSVDRFMGAVRGCDVEALQIGLEFSSGDPGDFCTNPAEVLSLSADCYRIAHLGTLAADVTLPGHCHGPHSNGMCRERLSVARFG